MRLAFDNIRVQVGDQTPADTAWLFDFLSFTDGSGFYRGKKKQARFRLFDMLDLTFPTGNLGAVVRERRRLGLPIELVDTRHRPCVPRARPALGWLRWYQREAVEAAVKRGRGIIKVPTGGGKTEIAIGIWRSLPCRWLFIAHRAQLMNNGADRFVKRERERLEHEISALHQLDAQGVLDAGELEDHQAELEQLIEAAHAGRYGDGVDDVQQSDTFCFATFQGLHATLAGRGGELLRWAEGVIIDECHVQPADTFFAVTQAAPNAYYRFGLSGTPLQRGDRRNVLAVGALGKILYKIRAKTLIDEGTIAYPVMRFVQHDNSHDAPKASRCARCKGSGEVLDQIISENVLCEACDGSGFAKTKWKTVYRHMVIDSTTRNRLCTEIAKQQAKPGIVFVEAVDHGKILKKMFEQAGITTRFVYGSRSSTKQRDAALEDLARGHIDLLITTRIMQEGIDVPSIASVFNAPAGKSAIGVLQKLGRGGRVTKTKNTMEFWDIYDVGHQNLRRQANARRDAMASETECPVETIEDSRQLALTSGR